jgi:hypothetical protein
MQNDTQNAERHLQQKQYKECYELACDSLNGSTELAKEDQANMLHLMIQALGMERMQNNAQKSCFPCLSSELILMAHQCLQLTSQIERKVSVLLVLIRENLNLGNVAIAENLCAQVNEIEGNVAQNEKGQLADLSVEITKAKLLSPDGEYSPELSDLIKRIQQWTDLNALWMNSDALYEFQSEWEKIEMFATAMSQLALKGKEEQILECLNVLIEYLSWDQVGNRSKLAAFLKCLTCSWKVEDVGTFMRALDCFQSENLNFVLHVLENMLEFGWIEENRDAILSRILYNNPRLSL